MITNAQKLSAVLTKWLEPVILQLGGEKMMSIPILSAIQNKVRATGWVSPQWSMVSELQPILGRVSGNVVRPLIANFISQYPDKDLPSVAHGIVDAALAQGKLEIMEGNVIFDAADLQQLKRLLNCNLPIAKEEEYVVKTELDNTEEL